MQEHLVYQKTDHQGPQLHPNDVEIGIECGAHGRWVQKKHVRSFVGRSRRILNARLFLQEEHLRTEAWIMRAETRSAQTSKWMVYDAVPQYIREWVLCSYTEAVVVSL